MDTVTINGVTLTRQQVEEAFKELNKPKPITLNSSGASVQERPATLHVPLSDERFGPILLSNRLGGSHKDHGIFVSPAPNGYKWALINEGGLTVLVMQEDK